MRQFIYKIVYATAVDTRAYCTLTRLLTNFKQNLERESFSTLAIDFSGYKSISVSYDTPIVQHDDGQDYVTTGRIGLSNRGDKTKTLRLFAFDALSIFGHRVTDVEI
jgi:hypothetical protein